MTDMIDVHELQQAVLWDRDGTKLGIVGEIHLDKKTDVPEWITVPLHLFQSKERFIPLRGAHRNGDDIFVDYTYDQVNKSPNIDTEHALNFAQERELREYYGLAAPEAP